MTPLIIDDSEQNFSFIEHEKSNRLVFPRVGIADVNEEYDIDSFISSKFLPQIDQIKKTFDCLVLPISLTENFFEFTGLRLAYHIRLLSLENPINKIPIIFFSHQTVHELIRLSNLSAILGTEGVYFIPISNIQNELNKLIENDLPGLNSKEEFLEKIFISPPLKYRSHHSLANEWGLWRMHEIFNIPKEHIVEFEKSKNKSILIHSLYFKYLKALGDSQKFRTRDKIPLKINGIEDKTIIYIDDNNKGWSELLNLIFQESNAKLITYENFKDSDSEHKMIEGIKQFLIGESVKDESLRKVILNADLYIIDLRLHESDFEEEKDFQDYTGFKVVDFIKELNQGNQVLIFTASNKVWNLKYALNGGDNIHNDGVSGYIIKESPELHFSRIESKEIVGDFIDTIRKALKNSFLKSFYSIIINIKSNFSFSIENWKNNNDIKSYFEKLANPNGWLDQFYFLIKQSTKASEFESNNILNQALLIFFQIIENYANLESNFHDRKVITKTQSEIEIFNSTKDKARIKFILGYFTFQIPGTNLARTSIHISSSSNQLIPFDPVKDDIFIFINILYFKHEVSTVLIEKILELRFYRSKMVAHDEKVIDKTLKKIEIKDIKFMLEVIEIISLNK